MVAVAVAAVMAAVIAAATAMVAACGDVKYLLVGCGVS